MNAKKTQILWRMFCQLHDNMPEPLFKQTELAEVHECLTARSAMGFLRYYNVDDKASLAERQARHAAKRALLKDPANAAEEQGGEQHAAADELTAEQKVAAQERSDGEAEQIDAMPKEEKAEGGEAEVVPVPEYYEEDGLHCVCSLHTDTGTAM